MKEVLAIPEEHLATVIECIRRGCREPEPYAIPLVVKRQLRKWCNEMESYLASNKAE